MAGSFNRFQRDIARKAVGNNNVRLVIRNFVRFDIADEVNIHMRIANHLSGFVNFFLALHFFGSDIQQSHARAAYAQGATRQNIAHHGKFGQIDGAAFGIGTKVEHDIFAVYVRHDADNGRTMDFLNGFEHQFGNSHQRTGIAGGNNSLSLAFAHSINRHVHAGVFVANDGRRFVFVADNFVGMADFANLLKLRIIAEGSPNFGFVAEQQKSDVRIFPGGNRQALYYDSGGIISPHCVD